MSSDHELVNTGKSILYGSSDFKLIWREYGKKESPEEKRRREEKKTERVVYRETGIVKVGDVSLLPIAYAVTSHMRVVSPEGREISLYVLYHKSGFFFLFEGFSGNIHGFNLGKDGWVSLQGGKIRVMKKVGEKDFSITEHDPMVLFQ